MLLNRLVSFSNLTLLVALILSTVAAYYSIIGLTAIFAGAVIPIIIMGSILEIGKITTTVWLRKYWHRASLTLKFYLVPAVVLLAFLTSMGIFGFLSKAHSDQSLISGDALSKLEVVDERIKTSKDNIEVNRKALKQLDEAVDQVMGRSTSEAGAEKAVAIRKAQARDRARLLSEIQAEQKIISKLNEEAAPIRAEVRKIEAEVGPIKYIAAFIYGDNPDNNLLESAVRWVIILIVIVFDPLAIALVLAANASKEWDKEDKEKDIPKDEDKPPLPTHVADVIIPEPDNNLVEQPVEEPPPKVNKPMQFFDPGEHPKDNLEKSQEVPVVEHLLPEPDPIKKRTKKEKTIPKEKAVVVDIPEAQSINEEIITDGVTKENPLTDLHDGYVLYDGKHYSVSALKEIKPDLFISVDNARSVDTNFGTKFPNMSRKGDVFVRVDALPNRVYKFDGKRWIEINKETTSTYLHDKEYVKYLINKISVGEYDTELLSETEREQIEDYLKNQNT
jgi:hypothetical protein